MYPWPCHGREMNFPSIFLIEKYKIYGLFVMQIYYSDSVMNKYEFVTMNVVSCHKNNVTSLISSIKFLSDMFRHNVSPLPFQFESIKTEPQIRTRSIHFLQNIPSVAPDK
jgi:hypothetical protein